MSPAMPVTAKKATCTYQVFHGKIAKAAAY
jgi:hypothetical protein